MGIGHRTGSVARHVFLALLLASGSRSLVEGQEARLTTVVEEALPVLITQLEEYAAWCQEEQLFAERNRAYELLLRFRGDHATARKTLGFKRKGDEWLPARRKKEAKNLDPEALEEAPARLLAATAPFTEALGALLERENLSSAERTELERSVLLVDPNNERVHAGRRETKHHGEWVLDETVAARRRRVELKDIVHTSFRDAPRPTTGELIERETDFELDFQIATTRDLRVLSTASAEEAVEIARDIQVARDVFDEVMGLESLFPEKCTVFVLANEGEGASFLAHHPDIDPTQRSWLEKVEGSGISGTGDWAFWTGPSEKRADGVLRIAIGYLLFRSFYLSPENGWAYEGFGIYLTHALLGTRLTWMLNAGSSVDPRAAFKIRNRLQDPTTNWIREAHGILLETPPDFEALFEKSATSLTAEELLISYALAAYLIEGHPHKAPRLLQRIGNGIDPRKAFLTTLDADLSRLGGRVERWMAENYEEELRTPVAASKLRHDWEAFGTEERAVALELFRKKIAELESSQLALVRELGGTDYVDVALVEDRHRREHYDPKTHAPKDPIRRKWLEADDPLVVEVHDQFFGRQDPGDLIRGFEYDWSQRVIVRTGASADIDTVFTNATNGYPPGLDLALAVAERELDGGDLAPLMVAFGHVYTDLEGRVYPGTTLYDAWASGIEIAMPDVDALGVIHDVFDDWETWEAPVPNSEHEWLYGVIEVEYRKVRRYRTLRETLARLLFLGSPTGSLFLPARTNLHALLDQSGSKLTKLKRKLPDQAEQEEWLAEWVERCKGNEKLWKAGRRRQTRLTADGERVVAALAEAMQEAQAPSGD